MITWLFALALAMPSSAPAPSHQMPSAAQTVKEWKTVTVNGVEVPASERAKIAAFGKLHNGDYWYDAKSGLWGHMGAAPGGLLPPNLQLGKLISSSSIPEGDIYINNRKAHPVELDFIELLIGKLLPGRYSLDAAGNFGLVNGENTLDLRDRIRQLYDRSEAKPLRNPYSGKFGLSNNKMGYHAFDEAKDVYW